jgi:hypothetical protein
MKFLLKNKTTELNLISERNRSEGRRKPKHKMEHKTDINVLKL